MEECELSDEVLIEKGKSWVYHFSKMEKRDWASKVPVNFDTDQGALFSEILKRFQKAKNRVGELEEIIKQKNKVIEGLTGSNHG